MLGIGAAEAAAQTGREVVQPLPPAGIDDLNEALRRLARNSRDVSALIDAGSASLELGDIDAAIGFFGRADDLSPGNPRVKVGLAGAFVRSERPLEALRLFAEARDAGVSTSDLAADWGLAFDLVGDNANAQNQYRIAVAQRANDEALRRLALSQAISGQRDAFEATLLPMLERNDLAAFRTRAFGLAILGDEQEAVTIVQTVMPGKLSERIVPYLRYMPRLTAAQQAAAANLGVFPKAARIGRDDPRIASYATSSTPTMRGADTRLAPTGTPLGSGNAPTTDRSSAVTPVQPRPEQARSPGTARGQLREASDAMMRTRRQRNAPAQVPPTASTNVAPVATPASAPIPTPQPATEVASELPASRSSSTVESAPSSSASSATAQKPAPVGPGFDLRTQPNSSNPAVATVATTAPPVPTPSVADAFAAFASPRPMTVPPAADAVDITAIKPPVEKPVVAKAEPAKPAHPSRIWVQVATGRDRSALRFDWRRMARKAPEVLGDAKPYVADWGQTSRLLTGPFDNAKAARAALNALSEAGIDSFQFTSDEGEEIQPLP